MAVKKMQPGDAGRFGGDRSLRRPVTPIFGSRAGPELVVQHGYHFLASGLAPGTIEGWLEKGLDLRAIQRVVNHFHISTLFSGGEVSDDVAVEAARVIAQIWSRTLAPEGLVAEAFGTDYATAGVTFYRGAD